MKQPSAIAKALLLGLLVSTASLAQLPEPVNATAPTPPAAVFRLLAGCWGMQKDGEKTEEQWLAPASNGLIGMARTVKGGKAIEREFMHLQRADDGQWSYIASLPGQPDTAFALTRLSHFRVPGSYLARFENPGNAFPTVITYRQPSRNILVAAIEGTLNAQPARMEYAYTRVPCLR